MLDLKQEEKEELFHAAEENFFEANFEVGCDEETMKENYKNAIRIFYDKYAEAEKICESIVDGEIIDEVTALMKVQELIISYKYADRFRMSLTGEHIVNPATIQLPCNRKEIAMKGNEYLGKYAQSRNYDYYEKGKWLLHYAMSN